MTEIQLLVGDSGDRDAVESLFDDRFDVVTDTDVRAADLYLVDEHAFPDYHEALQARVDDSDPVFCPVVLIRHPESVVEVTLPAAAERESPLLVDDIVDAPLERTRLLRRVESLLARRRQSAALQETVLELEDTNQRLERLASVLSHDLRNPIQVAQTRLELLKTAASSSVVDEHVEPIERAVVRMAGLTDELLTFARTDPGQVQRESVDLSEVVADAWTDTGTVAVSNATLVQEDLDVTVAAGRERLLQVFENLFRNAVEHGGADVTVTVGRLSDGFYVADDGPGIPEAEREEVFTMGYSTNTDGTGNGLGLNIVEEVVAEHDWSVEVTESEAGGARFEVRDVDFH
jgi:signal transduction histidine kinase